MQKTIAFYCEDLFKQLEPFQEIRFDRKRFRTAIEQAKNSDYDNSVIDALLVNLEHAAGSVIKQFSQFPENTPLQSYYMRTQCIIDMCKNIREPL